MNSDERQLDIPASLARFYNIPKYAPGRMTGKSFVQFQWSNTLNPKNYTVVVEPLDTSGDRFRSIGELEHMMELPFVQYDPHAKLGVIPHDARYPAFWSEVGRGCTYIIPNISKSGVYTMQMLGVQTTGM